MVCAPLNNDKIGILGSFVSSLPPSMCCIREFPYIFVYCFSCRHVAQLDLQQLGPLALPAPKERLAENGGLDPSCLDFAFLGCPYFQSIRPKLLVLKVFGTSGRKIGAPQKREIQARQSKIQPRILSTLSRETARRG